MSEISPLDSVGVEHSNSSRDDEDPSEPPQSREGGMAPVHWQPLEPCDADCASSTKNFEFESGLQQPASSINITRGAECRGPDPADNGWAMEPGDDPFRADWPHW